MTISSLGTLCGKTNGSVKTTEFDYVLPPELIAQQPLPERDASRLMLLDRSAHSISHGQFRELPGLLRDGDLLVLNDTKVIPARLWARKTDTGARIELLLLDELALNRWRTLARPARKLKPGVRLAFDSETLTAEVRNKNDDGPFEIEFRGVADVRQVLGVLGDVPLPPYIARKPREQHARDAERYQTIFARREGAVAAPTAGLHFTEATFAALKAKGIEAAFVTLEVGLGTFQPVKAEDVEDHKMHEERFEVSEVAARQIHAAKQASRRVVAVGTTSLRVLETVAPSPRDPITPVRGSTRLFIHPPYQFQVVDALLTNFHLPRSTLLMLVSAFAGREFILRAYAEAIRQKYRFYSYGDCMLIV